MALPPPVFVGEILKATTVNDHLGVTRQNLLRQGPGIRLTRSLTGTTVSAIKKLPRLKQPGRLVTVLNNTGGDLPAWAISGIEKTTRSANLTKLIAEDLVYVLRKPVDDDKSTGWLITAVAIKDKAVGQAYVSGDGILARVKFAEDGSEDDLRFAEIDPSKDSGDEQFLYPSASGSARILDKEESDIPEGWRWVVVRFPTGASGGVIDNPHDLTYTGEHPEEANPSFYVNADGDEVMIDLREPPEGTLGFKITYSTGLSYYDDSDETLYAYVIDVYYTNEGAVQKVLRELRPTVDVPEECVDETPPPQQVMGG